MKMKAINDHVIVKEMKREDRVTKGGLFIPATVKEEPQKFGKVVAVGPEVKNVVTDDVVVFAKFGGQTFILDNEEYIVLKQPEVYCVLN